MADTNATLAAAMDDADSVVKLTLDLVRIPSRGGIDPYEPIVEKLASWLTSRRLPADVLVDDTGGVVGLACEIRGGHPGPRWVLNACLDTAPFGDEAAWSHPPTAGVVEDGWLWGRGSADSKVGAAIFCHVAVRVAAMASAYHGNLVLLFDVDEHTGGFGGARRYFEGPDAPADVSGVMIGYPGMDNLVIGGRGIYRVQLNVYGTSSHSGSSTSTPSAIQKAAEIVRILSAADLSGEAVADFPLPGKLTITAVHGGDGYSLTPDLCVLNVDIRTTPAFDSNAARLMLEQVADQIDHEWPDTRSTTIQTVSQWPPFVLDRGSRLYMTMFEAAEAVGINVSPRIAGPSNIGNLLAGHGIPTTAGFGVAYEVCMPQTSASESARFLQCKASITTQCRAY